MLDSFPDALRALREQNKLSTRDLARLTHFSPTYLNQVETGVRTATEDIAVRCDQAFGTTPLLATLLSIEKGNTVLRRALFGGTLAVAGGALLSQADSTAALAAAINAGLRAHLGQHDYDDIAEEFARRHTMGAGPGFGTELAAQIMVAHQEAIEGNRDAARGAAKMTLTYGLWVADAGKLPTARSLYATSAALADHSTDRQLRAHVRARAASRAPYEGWTAKQTTDAANQALAIDSKGSAAVEAYGALVHVAALTGQLDMGRAAVQAMYAVADSDLAYLRANSFDNYLECRCGSMADANAAYDRTHAGLAAVPPWQAEATIYYGRALVAAGAVDGGARTALDAIRTRTAPTRIFGWGVRDVLAAVPAGVASESVAALRGYASTGPAPWETIR